MKPRLFLVTLAFATNTLAATVTFDPLTADSLPGTPGLQIFAGTPVVLDVWVATDVFPAIQGVELVIGSDNVASLDANAPGVWTWPCPETGCRWWSPPGDFDIYPHEIAVGRNFLTDLPQGSSLLFGRLTLATDVLSPGDYAIFVDPNRDLGLSNVLLGAQADPFAYSAFAFQIIPEPATVILAGFTFAFLILIAPRARNSAPTHFRITCWCQ